MSDSSFFSATAVTKFKGELPQRGVEYTGTGKFCDLRLKSLFISETARDRLMVTMDRE